MPKPLIRHVGATAALALVLVAGLADAQPGAPAMPPASAGIAQPGGAPQSDPTLSVKFPGGTTAEYVKYLKSSASFPLNVVLSPSASNVRLAAIELESVDAETAVRSIAAATDEMSGSWRIERIGPQQRLVTNGNGISELATAAGQPAFAVDYRPNSEVFAPGRNAPNLPKKGNPAATVSTEPRVSVNAVRDLLQDPAAPAKSVGVPAEILLSAVQAALGSAVTPDDPAPDVKFHPEAALLIVRGTDAQQAIVKNVLDQMRKDAEARRSIQDERMQDAMKRVGISVELREAETRRRAAEERAHAAGEKMERLRRLHESGGVSDAEIDAAKAEFQRAREELSLAGLQADRVDELAKLTRDRGDSWIALVINTKSLSPAEFDRFDKTLQTIIFSGQDRFGGHFPAADRSNIRLWTEDEMATRLDALAKEFGCDSYRDFPSDPPATGGGGAPGTPAK